MSLFDETVSAMKKSLNDISDLVVAKNTELSELRAALIEKDQEIAALQDRLEEANQRIWGLVGDIGGFENAETELVDTLQALIDYHEGDYEVIPEVKQAQIVIAKIRGEEVDLVDIGDGLKAHPAILAAILPDEE